MYKKWRDWTWPRENALPLDGVAYSMAVETSGEEETTSKGTSSATGVINGGRTAFCNVICDN